MGNIFKEEEVLASMAAARYLKVLLFDSRHGHHRGIFVELYCSGIVPVFLNF